MGPPGHAWKCLQITSGRSSEEQGGHGLNISRFAAKFADVKPADKEGPLYSLTNASGYRKEVNGIP